MMTLCKFSCASERCYHLQLFFFFFLLLFLCFCKRLQPPQSNSVALSTLYVLPLSVQCLELCPTTFLEQIGTHKFAQQWERSRCTACSTGRAGVLRRIFQCKQSSFLKALILQTSFLLKIWMDQKKKKSFKRASTCSPFFSSEK